MREPSSKPRNPGPVIPAQPRWHGRLAGWLAFLLSRLIALTLRWRWRHDGGPTAVEHSQPVLFAIWHNRILLSTRIFNHITRHDPGRRLATLVSASRDGGLIAYVLTLDGVVPARGSSSRRGAAALLDLVRLARSGCDVAITPDGPRGPRYQVQDGILTLAQLSGLPIVPVAYNLSWKKVLRSWDGFQIPLPFSRCEVHFGQAIRVPREVTEAELARFRDQLREALQQLTRD